MMIEHRQSSRPGVSSRPRSVSDISPESVSTARGTGLSTSYTSQLHLMLSERELDEADAAICRELELSHWSSNARSRWSAIATFRPGALVARRYVIEAFLARGGMGEIYSTFDQMLGERVALKTLLSVAADDPAAVRALRAEVRLARRIAHPNVCRVYDVGVCDDDPRDVVHFMTMELIAGESLPTRLQRQRLPLGECLEIASQLLLGLDAVHRAGVLHRDIKSQNILFRQCRPPTHIVLADFGLARRLDGRQRASGAPSSGSLAYMAPEQMAGQELSPQTDLFAFGVVMYEMLTGSLPFRKPGEQLTNFDLENIFRGEVRVAWPAELARILRRCLSHEPEARPPSAQALRAELMSIRF
jgi:eukaryotic-like serine/threonine-protein kinase